MEDNEYVFVNTFYDKEVLRRAIIAMNDEEIDYKLIDKSNRGHFRAPLSTYIETDLLVHKNCFDRAAELLKMESE